MFFHFSQFSGTIEHLKIGDPVEFEMTYDRRTGKPIASAVTKIAPEVVSNKFTFSIDFLNCCSKNVLKNVEDALFLVVDALNSCKIPFYYKI